jgi:hypothetical protein
MFTLITEESQFQRERAKWHWRNKWLVDSICLQHRLHMEGRRKPLRAKFSSVASLLWRSLHTMKDLEGGIALFQINLVHPSFWLDVEVKRYASLRLRSPLFECFQSNWSSFCSEGIEILLMWDKIFGKDCYTCQGICHCWFTIKSETIEWRFDWTCWGKL